MVMRRGNRTAMLLVCIAVTAALFAACASSPTRESTGEYVDDSAITAKVKAAIAKESTLAGYQVSVETYKGIVQLSGFVDSEKSRSKAGEVAAGVKGVKSVKNNLVVK
jgi:osmotically-inducible protein OsmY